MNADVAGSGGNPVVLLQHVAMQNLSVLLLLLWPPHAAPQRTPRAAAGSQRALDRRWAFTALSGRWNHH